ncbi:hypothetical protein Tco_0122667, partial [Tanacetum coccineum]
YTWTCEPVRAYYEIGSYQLVSELFLPFEVPTLGVVAYGVVAWNRKKKGANRDQHSRDQRAQSGGLWNGGLDPKRGASRDQRGRWLFKVWGIVMIPHWPSMGLVDLTLAKASPTFRGSNTRSGGLWSGGLDPKRGANRDQHSRDQRGRWFFKGWGIVMIPHRPTSPTFRGSNTRSGGLWSGGLDPKRGANRDQHSRDQRVRSGGLWTGGLDPKRGANRDQHSRDQRGRWFFKGWGIVMIPHRPKLALPFEVPTLGVVAYGVVAWTQKKKGANRDQHSRDQRARSGGLWSGGLDPKRGANRDQRGRWFFKGWGIVMIPHRPSMGLVDGL